MDSKADESVQTIIEGIKQATGQDDKQLAFQAIYQAVSQHRKAHLLDPLEIIPILLSEPAQAAQDILSLVGECGNAKEILLVTQELLERMRHVCDSDVADGVASIPCQLLRLIDLCSSCIPRLQLHRKPLSHTLRWSLSGLQSSIDLVGHQATQTEGREIIRHASQLIQRITPWVKSVAVGDQADELSPCITILSQLLDMSLAACAHSINSSLATRTFRIHFPRLAARSSVPEGWEAGEAVVSIASDAYGSLDFTVKQASMQPDMVLIGSLIYVAHSAQSLPPARVVLSGMLMTLMTSIRSGKALDECISLLLRVMATAVDEKPKPELSADVILPLFTVLPPLASSHPDPDIRLQVYRIISLTLSLAPHPLRLQLLYDLASNFDVPQMATAALSLVKEAVLNALSNEGQDVFASPLLLQTFGRIIFLSRPTDFFSSSHSVEDLRESPELRRLSECLSLYYVLLARDDRNRTGVRSPDAVRDVEKSLLAPLRTSLVRWSDIAKNEDVAVSLVSLQIGLERVDSFLEANSLR